MLADADQPAPSIACQEMLRVKLYITPGSPYARMARIVIIEKGLQDRVEVVVAQTRRDDSPYYAINPSGRVPYLLRDDGEGLEESQLICAWLDHLDGHPRFGHPAGDAGWESRRLEALARSLTDGIAVWTRELVRPQAERSPTTVRHEAARARRLTDLWETLVGHPLMSGDLNLPQITLACGLGMDVRTPGFEWREGHPRLCAWFDRITARPSFAATAPPASH